jgi:hypothetical protein
LWIGLAGELDSVGRGEVLGGWGDGEENARLKLGVAVDEGLKALLDVGRLVADSNTCDTGEVDKCHGEDAGGVNTEADLFLRDGAVALGRLLRDLVPHVGEIEEGLAGTVEELSPLGGIRACAHELKHQRAPRAHSSAAWEEVTPYKGL